MAVPVAIPVGWFVGTIGLVTLGHTVPSSLFDGKNTRGLTGFDLALLGLAGFGAYMAFRRFG